MEEIVESEQTNDRKAKPADLKRYRTTLYHFFRDWVLDEEEEKVNGKALYGRDIIKYKKNLSH